MKDGEPDRDVLERMTAALEAHPGYRLAEEDPDFLESEMARPARVALELMRPEGALREHRINSTVVVWGSARIVSPDEARRGLAEAEAAAAARPGDTRTARLRAEALRRLRYSRYYDEARALARALATACTLAERRDFVVITGGGPGIMEAANRGAWEAGSVSIGLNIDLPSEQRPNPFITPGLAFRFHYFALRKMHFMLRARALVAFPGGFGTMDELFEALTLVQTRRISRIPLVLVGRDYWNRVIDFRFLVEEGFVDEADLGLFELVETGEEAAQAIRSFFTASPGA
jgi:uncharacterized protein (TIGR00730 family)